MQDILPPLQWAIFSFFIISIISLKLFETKSKSLHLAK